MKNQLFLWRNYSNLKFKFGRCSFQSSQLHPLFANVRTLHLFQFCHSPIFQNASLPSKKHTHTHVWGIYFGCSNLVYHYTLLIWISSLMDRSSHLYLLITSLLLLQCVIDYSSANSNTNIVRSSLISFKSRISSDPHNILSQNWRNESNIRNWIGDNCDSHSLSQGD